MSDVAAVVRVAEGAEASRRVAWATAYERANELALIRGCFSQWSHLNHGAFRVLVFLAAAARFRHGRWIYAGGSESIAEALGRMPETAAERNASRVSVARFVSELVTAGALERLVSGYPGRRSEYVVLVSIDESRD